MDVDPGTLPIIILIVVFVLFGIAISIGVIRNHRTSSLAARRELDPLLARLAAIAGTPSPHPVKLYAVHSSFVNSTEYQPTAFLTRENAVEVEELARQLRAFSLRWAKLFHRSFFTCIIIDWNYQGAIAKITAFRHSQ